MHPNAGHRQKLVSTAEIGVVTLTFIIYEVFNPSSAIQVSEALDHLVWSPELLSRIQQWCD